MSATAEEDGKATRTQAADGDASSSTHSYYSYSDEESAADELEEGAVEFFDVIIIGAGTAGLCMGNYLQRLAREAKEWKRQHPKLVFRSEDMTFVILEGQNIGTRTLVAVARTHRTALAHSALCVCT